MPDKVIPIRRKDFLKIRLVRLDDLSEGQKIINLNKSYISSLMDNFGPLEIKIEIKR